MRSYDASSSIGKKVVVIEESAVPARFIDLRIFRREVSRRTFTAVLNYAESFSVLTSVPIVLVISTLVHEKRVFNLIFLLLIHRKFLHLHYQSCLCKCFWENYISFIFIFVKGLHSYFYTFTSRCIIQILSRIRIQLMFYTIVWFYHLLLLQRLNIIINSITPALYKSRISSNTFFLIKHSREILLR